MAGAEDPADALYELPLDEFTAARNALVKELKAGGDKEAAAAVQALRKPSVTAWALNQLARRDPEAIDALLDAGAEVRAAHAAAMAGDASKLREASRAEQAVIGDLARKAAGLLDGDGTKLDRLSETLRAAATDPDAGEVLRAGRLTADLDAAGFGLGEPGLTLVPPLRSPAKKKAGATGQVGGAAGDDGADVDAEAEAEAEAEKQRQAQAEAEHRAAVRAAERARKEADQAAGRAERLEREAERAEAVAVEARDKATEARAEADRADVEATEAEQAARR
jgi:hypothetical protein